MRRRSRQGRRQLSRGLGLPGEADVHLQRPQDQPVRGGQGGGRNVSTSTVCTVQSLKVDKSDLKTHAGISVRDHTEVGIYKRKILRKENK